MLKLWFYVFDPNTKRLHLRHLWVHLSSFPLEIRNRPAFEAVGNHKRVMDKRFEKILVEIDMSLGLFEQLEIEWRGRPFTQTLDY